MDGFGTAMNLRVFSIGLLLAGAGLTANLVEPQGLGAAPLQGQAPASSGTGKLRIYDVPEPVEELAQDPGEQQEFLQLQQIGEPAQRTPLIETFVQKYPESNYLGQVHHMATLDYRSLNRPEKMFEHGQKTLRHSPDNIPVLALMALAHSDKGDPDRSVQLATKALGLLQKIVRPANTDPRQWETEYRQYMAQSLAGLGHAYLVKFEMERESSQKAPQPQGSSTNPTGPEADPARPQGPGTATGGGSRLAALHLARAYGYFTKSLNEEPRSQFVHFQLGVVSTRLKRFPQAIDAFARASLLEGGYREISRRNLESLYRVTHQDSLDGLQDLLAQARADLAGGDGKPAPVAEDSAEPGSQQ